ncbi:hypothetical protein [Mucilaginibacter terrae]|uniref:Uncharacterized protein n=1 Tax=Mucilaginibacter terrae TaxID=1955052 RepID=A0ABU3GR74_9SPHI|nr:hypothetical protein [Mucilaginibacter terrae]MDT3402283.1 hypothetical protein [Mucilaginibacter terrae]
MVPFNLELEFPDQRMTGTAEQLDQIADNDGFMRYQVSLGERRSIICVNIEEGWAQSVSAADSESSHEGVQDPGHHSGISEDEVFKADEVGIIVSAIKAYNDSRKLTFDQMHFDF